jgi:hypothetical protein
MLQTSRDFMEENTTLAKIDQPVIPEVHLIARSHEEMSDANSQMIEWMKKKIAFEQHHLEQVEENLEVCKRNRWSRGALISSASLARGNVRFYEKILTALESGYAILPQFPVDLFAIRTTKSKPSQDRAVGGMNSWNDPGTAQQEPANVPAGEGEYVSDQARRMQSGVYKVQEDGKEVEKRNYWNDSFQEVAFPVTAVKPELLRELEQATKRKIFDAFGIVAPQSRRGDPIIVGRIVGPSAGWSGRKTVNFLIAWFMDLRTL